MDAILGVPFRILDDGFIRVVDYMGTDESVVEAARVSYGTGTKRHRDNRALLRYLMRHQHTTPFEMCEIKLHVRVPMDAWRQWIRHRTANVNEYSTRYSVAISSAQRTPPEAWRLQDARSRQGSAGFLDRREGETFSRSEADLQDAARHLYEGRLAAGIAREQARKDLPLSTYTEAYWKIDLHNLLHFLSLRMAPTAQAEIRSYALVMGHDIVRRWCPETWSAFLDYRMNGLQLSETEVAVVAAVARGNMALAIEIAARAGWVSQDGSTASRSRERVECDEKLARLGLPSPWTAPPGAAD